MFVKKNFGIWRTITFSSRHLSWLSLWATSFTVTYELTEWKWLAIPWLPLSAMAIAVAFYLGFKNNQAYDRLWEARKIWGAIVNSSRAWGSTVKSFVSDFFAQKKIDADELDNIKKRLIYRHIAWLYALRSQLLVPTEWEHINQGRLVSDLNKDRMKKFGIGLIDDHNPEKTIKEHLPEGEFDELASLKNTATQLIDRQAMELQKLRQEGLIDDFRHMELQKILNDFYVHQGKAERIKKFPFPRQYGSTSFIFVGIFVFLLPFGMVAEFEKLGEWGTWLAIPFIVLVSWIFIVMELVGDYSENPFEGLENDIPMFALCRTIEIDLKEMLGETDLPPAATSKKGILM